MDTGLPLVISISVIVCHLSIATNHFLSFLRQLRSITSLFRSSPRVSRIFSRRASEKRPEGNRKEVMMTYYQSNMVNERASDYTIH